MACLGCESKIKSYHTDNLFTWCTNCGNYGIFAAVKRALVAEDIEPHQAALIFDIGCNGNGADKIAGYRFHGLHGRAIPLAAGVALANHDFKVVAFGGDGGTLSEGIGHLIHAIRCNYNFTFLLHNNSNYGLTTGQASATTPEGVPMNVAPDGVDAQPLNVMELVLSLNPSFAARTFSGDVKQMTEIFRAAMNHKGFSFVEILQTCTTYNKATPHEWYQERVYDTLFEEGYDNSNLEAAKATARDLQERIATGVLYLDKDRPDFISRQANRQEATTTLVQEVKNYDISALTDPFRG